jgi:cytoskeletal protein CcmA (bactofilin family)
MAMFQQKVDGEEPQQVSATKEKETIIGPSVRVDGNFKGQGDVIIEGSLHGSVRTDKDLTIGPNARISANAAAANATISGEVKGSLKIKGRLELTETARVFGDIKTEVLIIAPGAIFHGKCEMVKDIPVDAPDKDAAPVKKATKKKSSK